MGDPDRENILSVKERQATAHMPARGEKTAHSANSPVRQREKAFDKQPSR